MIYTGKKVGRDFTDKELDDMLKIIDSNNDNRISLPEYTAHIQRGLEPARKQIKQEMEAEKKKRKWEEKLEQAEDVSEKL